MAEKLTTDFQKIFHEKKFSDVTLNCGGKIFHLHKVILSGRSPVFAAMFNNDMEEIKNNRVNIIDIDPETMSNLLSYIYCGKFSNKEIYCELYAAADKYQIEDLMEECYQHILKTVNDGNVIKYLKFADTYNRKELKELTTHHILNFMDEEKLKTITSSEDWKNMIITCPNIASEVILSFHASHKKLKGINLKPQCQDFDSTLERTTFPGRFIPYGMR